MKNKSKIYTIISLITSFILLLTGLFTSYPEKIFYFSAGMILFLIGDYFLVKTIFNKKLKVLNSKK